MTVGDGVLFVVFARLVDVLLVVEDFLVVTIGMLGTADLVEVDPVETDELDDVAAPATVDSAVATVSKVESSLTMFSRVDVSYPGKLMSQNRVRGQSKADQ